MILDKLNIFSLITVVYVKNIISFERYKHILLLDKGIELGEFLINRHNTIEKFLKLLNANINLTYETEKIEHTLSNETLNKINVLVNFFENNENILKFFHDFSRNY